MLCPRRCLHAAPHAPLACLPPLLLPQASLLFGLRLRPGRAGIHWHRPWLGTLSQLIFVFHTSISACTAPIASSTSAPPKWPSRLGASPWGPGGESRAPLLARPLLFAFGVGAAVSLAHHPPTLLFRGGRVITITTGGGGYRQQPSNRRLAGLYGLLQLLLPLSSCPGALMPRRINPP